MTTLRTTYVQLSYANSDEYREVMSISEQLLTHLNEPGCQSKLSTVNSPGNSSALVQGVVAEFAVPLGFVNEAQGLFESYSNKAVRPDYHLRIRDTGILMEVERGKTTINNMDFLDFWKCHLCVHANYLFLLVPQQLHQSATGRPRNEYKTVVQRMSSFFVPRNYTNVRALHIFGY